MKFLNSRFSKSTERVVAFVAAIVTIYLFFAAIIAPALPTSTAQPIQNIEIVQERFAEDRLIIQHMTADSEKENHGYWPFRYDRFQWIVRLDLVKGIDEDLKNCSANYDAVGPSIVSTGVLLHRPSSQDAASTKFDIAAPSGPVRLEFTDSWRDWENDYNVFVLQIRCNGLTTDAYRFDTSTVQRWSH